MRKRQLPLSWNLMLHGTTVHQPPLTVFIHQNPYQEWFPQNVFLIYKWWVVDFANIFLQWPPIKTVKNCSRLVRCTVNWRQYRLFLSRLNGLPESLGGVHKHPERIHTFCRDPSYSSDRFSFSQFVRLYIFFQKSCNRYLDTGRSAAQQPRVLRNRRLLLMPGELICCHHGGLQRSGLVIRCWKWWHMLSKLGYVTRG